MSVFGQGILADVSALSDQESLYRAEGQLANIAPGGMRSYIDVVYETHASESFPGFVLPRLTADNIIYYFVAQAPKQWRSLLPIVTAFAGSTIISDVPLDPGDPVDLELMNLFRGRISKRMVLQGATNFEQKKMLALKAVYRMAKTVMEAPSIVGPQRVSLSQLLDRYELALEEGDTRGCQNALDALQESHLLDRLNIQFLRARFYAGMGDWQSLVGWQGFERLCATRRPARMTNLLTKAFFQVELAGLGENLDALVERFNKAIYPRCGNLFNALPPGAGSEVLRTFAVHAVASSGEAEDVIRTLDRIAESGEPEDFVILWTECKKRLTPKTQPPTLPTFEDLLVHPVTPESARMVLSVAYESIDPAVRDTAVEYIRGLGADGISKMLVGAAHNTMWHDLSMDQGHSWDTALAAICTRDTPDAETLLPDLMNRISPVVQLPDAAAVKELLTGLEKTIEDQIGGPLLAMNLQAMLNWLREDPRFPTHEQVPLYLFLLELYALSDSISSRRLLSYSSLLESTLGCALSVPQYEQALDLTGVLVGSVRGAKEVDWLLELVNIAVDEHAPVEKAREILLWTVVDKLGQLGTELAVWQLAILRRVARVLGLDPSLCEKGLKIGQGESPLARYQGKSIAIYTLDPNAGRRVQDILFEICPTSKIFVNSEKYGGKDLRRLAKTVDVFVVAWRVAKHAATEDIKAHRPKQKITLYAKGKGASSILRELETSIA